MRLVIATGLFFAFSAAIAQLPAVDVYCADLKWTNGVPSASGVVNISARVGYDNQPSFSPDGKQIYYTSIRDSIQADIYAYDIASGNTRQITKTIESEYSPVFTADGDHFTVVRVEQDSTQRLWMFEPDGSKPKVILERVDSIGYYTALGAQAFAFFLVTDTPTLGMADMKKQEVQIIDRNIGRCIKQIPGTDQFSYLVKGEPLWQIYSYDLKKKKKEMITVVSSDSEDYVWTSDGKLLMAHQNKIWMLDAADKNASWQKVCEISELPGRTIFRMALSPDGTRLAFVASEK